MTCFFVARGIGEGLSNLEVEKGRRQAVAVVLGQVALGTVMSVVCLAGVGLGCRIVGPCGWRDRPCAAVLASRCLRPAPGGCHGRARNPALLLGDGLKVGCHVARSSWRSDAEGHRSPLVRRYARPFRVLDCSGAVAARRDRVDNRKQRNDSDRSTEHGRRSSRRRKRIHRPSLAEPEAVARVLDDQCRQIFIRCCWSRVRGCFIGRTQGHLGGSGQVAGLCRDWWLNSSTPGTDVFHLDRGFHRAVRPHHLLWVFLFNRMDLAAGGSARPLGRKVRPRALARRCPPPTQHHLRMSLTVLIVDVLQLQGEGSGGFAQELSTAPFGSDPLPYPNLVLNIVEYAVEARVARHATVRQPVRRRTDVHAARGARRSVFTLTWQPAARRPAGDGTAWSIFHILIIPLQAFIFMVLTVVYAAMATDAPLTLIHVQATDFREE